VNPKTISVLLGTLKSREIVTPEIRAPFFFVLKLQQDHGNLFCSEHNYDRLYKMQSLHQFLAELQNSPTTSILLLKFSAAVVFKYVSMSTNLATILALAIYVPCLLTKS
jgi:hypothetical protein